MALQRSHSSPTLANGTKRAFFESPHIYTFAAYDNAFERTSHALDTLSTLTASMTVQEVNKLQREIADAVTHDALMMERRMQEKTQLACSNQHTQIVASWQAEFSSMQSKLHQSDTENIGLKAKLADAQLRNDQLLYDLEQARMHLDRFSLRDISNLMGNNTTHD